MTVQKEDQGQVHLQTEQIQLQTETAHYEINFQLPLQIDQVLQAGLVPRPIVLIGIKFEMGLIWNGPAQYILTSAVHDIPLVKLTRLVLET